MMISLIVAASINNVIGKNNQLPWHLPNDMKYFKNNTWGMPVIMGRKTFESFGAGPLPGRMNVVISRQAALPHADPKVKVAATLRQAIDMAATADCKEVFVIGGAQVYAEAIAWADRIYLTRVEAVIEGDVYFPEMNTERWMMISARDFPADGTHAYPYSFQIWERRK